MAVVAVAAVLMLFLGVALLGQRRPDGDYYLAGRRAGAGSVAASVLATSLGASATVGIAARAYSIGWTAFWWLGSGCLGLVLLAWLWVPAIRREDGVRTLPEWLGTAYGQPARKLAAVLIAVMWTAVVAAQWAAAGAVLEAALGWPVTAGICSTAAAVSAYTAIGGQRSVLRTDLLQVAMLAVAAAVTVACVLRIGVGVGKLAAVRGDPQGAGGATPVQLAALIGVVAGMYALGPDMCSRVLVAESTSAARRGALIAAACLAPAALLLTMPGIALRAAGMQPPTARAALPYLIGHSGTFPPWAAALVNAGLLAALASSADTCLLTAASVVRLDLMRTPASESAGRAGAGRALVIGVGAAAGLVAWVSPRIIPNLLLAYAFYAGGLLVPLALLVMPRRAAAVPKAWLWTGMAAGGTLPVVLILTGKATDYAIAGAIGAVACFAVVAVGSVWGCALHPQRG